MTGLKLRGTAITNAVRCVPPAKQAGWSGNQHLPPISHSRNRPCTQLKVIITLGQDFSHDSTIRALGGKPAAPSLWSWGAKPG
jgi:hypothetical protein